MAFNQGNTGSTPVGDSIFPILYLPVRELLKLLLIGLYNHGEVIYLETKWFLCKSFGAYVYTHEYGNHVFDGWVEVMPNKHMIRYCEFNGSMIWRFSIVTQASVGGKPMIVKYRQWDMYTEPTDPETAMAVHEAIDKSFYNEVDNILD